MKKLIKLTFMMFFIVGLIGCGGSKNQYMIKETKEYNKITKNFIGKWTAMKYNSLLGEVYETVTVDFDFDTRLIKMSCKMSETVMADKMLDWKEKWPNIVVDNYKVVMTAKWVVSSTGEELAFTDIVYTVVINGTGDNFESFYVWEKTKMEGAKAMNKAIGGGLFGKIAQKGMQKGTKTRNFFPPFGTFAKIEFSKDRNSVTLNSKEMMKKYNLRLIKQQ